MTFMGVPVRPGAVHRERVRVGEFMDGSPVTMPVVTIGGVEPGPAVYIQAGLHGDEHTTIELCQRVISDLDPASLAGTVVCVPVANVPAFLARSAAAAHEERWPLDANRIVMAEADGSMTQRLASVLFSEFIAEADVTLDLHSAAAGCVIDSVAFVDPADDESQTFSLRLELARSFGVHSIYFRGGDGPGHAHPTTVAARADALGRAVVLLEMGESLRISHESVEAGLRGVHNCLKVMGMERGALTNVAPPREFTTMHPVRTTRGGSIRQLAALGQDVEAGAALTLVLDMFGNEVESIVAPVSGRVHRLELRGAVGSGSEVVRIAAGERATNGRSRSSSLAENLPQAAVEVGDPA